MNQNLFIGIGAQKCASTWLYDILADHPEVVLSTHKEVDFFSYEYERGFQWYERQFPENPQSKLCGEISPSYFVDLDTPARLRAFAPDAKILVSLRDPVERAVSNHRHEVRLGNFTGPDFSFEAGMRNNPMYLEQSRYGTQLRRWQEFFPRSQILVVFQEDIRKDPRKVARQVYLFLGIDTDHVPAALEKRSNESHLYKSRGIENMRKSIRELLRSIGMDGVWRAAQAFGLQGLYRRLNRSSPKSLIPPLSPSTEQRLRQQLENEITTVELMVGRTLAEWHAVVGSMSDPDESGAESSLSADSDQPTQCDVPLQYAGTNNETPLALVSRREIRSPK